MAASALSVTNVVPFLLGAIADRYGAGPLQLGLVNSCLTGASLLVAGSAPFWIYRISWPWVGGLAGLAITIDFLVSTAAPNMGAIYAVFLLAGVFSGLMSGPSNASLGFSSSPSRWYGISMVWQNVTAAAYYFIVPSWIQPHFGSQAAFTATAVMFFPCIVAGWFLRRSAQPLASPQHSVSVSRTAGGVKSWIVLCTAFAAAILVASGGVAFWLFLERLGKVAGIPESFIGLSLAIANMAALAGAVLSATVRTKFAASLSFGLLSGVVGFILMLVPSAPFFLASVCMYAFAWSLGMPVLQAVIRHADFTNRLFVASPSTVFIAAVVTGPVAGRIAELWGYHAAVYFSVGSWILALVCALYACASTRAHPAHGAAGFGVH